MPIYRLTPSFGLGGGNEVFYVKARTPRAAVVKWYCSNNDYKTSKQPRSRGYLVTPSIRGFRPKPPHPPTLEGPLAPFFVRAFRMKATKDNKLKVEDC